MTVNIEFALPRGHGLGPDDGKTDCFEAEAGILRRRQCLELQIEEARHMGDAARRQREPDIDRLDCTIDAVELSRNARAPTSSRVRTCTRVCIRRLANATTVSCVKIGLSR